MRSIFDEIDAVLLEMARHFGRDGAGWERTGLELTWLVSGQVAIGSHVDACRDGTRCVDFCVELRPSWYFGERSSTLSWEISTEIQADCQHAGDHGTMETVHQASARAVTALEAAATLRAAVRELHGRATALPLEHWLHLASDPVAGSQGAASDEEV